MDVEFDENDIPFSRMLVETQAKGIVRYPNA